MEGTFAEIIMFAGNFAPRNWAFCQGQTINIASNTALFSLLGTTFGGNGQTTFMLPDFRGRMPVGAGQGPGLSNYNLGQTGGNQTLTLTSSNMPAHAHAITLNCSAQSANSTTPVSNFPAVSEENPLYHSMQNATMENSTTGSAGGSQPFSIIPPVIGMNFVICLYGVFPSRN
jgi:microcystin-dependent protein